MIKQTDFTNENIRKYACLFFSLLEGIERQYHHKFKFEEINKIYAHLSVEKIMSPDCYVHNHEALLNHVIIAHLGQSEKAKYSGAYYLPGLPDSHRPSWGTFKNANHIILQFKTRNFSHFRAIDYDPYYPEPTRLFLMSVRYYKI